VRTSSRRLKPDSRQRQTPPDPTIGANIPSFAFLATEVANVKTKFRFLPQRMNSALIQASVTDNGFCITSKSVVIYGSELLNSGFLRLPFHTGSLKFLLFICSNAKLLVVFDENVSVRESTFEVTNEVFLDFDIVFLLKCTGVIDRSFSFSLYQML
jgi:hypothetical protein